MQRRLILAVIFLVILVIPAAAAGVIRTADQGKDGITTVTLVVSAGSFLGITEIIPDGAVVTSCSLPPSQWRAEGTYLHMAILEEQDVSYSFTSTISGEPAGTWVNFSDGSRGSVTAAGDEGTPADGAEVLPTPSSVMSAATQAGSSPILAGGTLAALAYAGYRRREEGA
ncbi:MAG: hypothetical protein JXA08_00470 [Methanomicrobiaceae archaeon]|nr:hypothetical protein [Methanomicrobiaceae archaeon]